MTSLPLLWIPQGKAINDWKQKYSGRRLPFIIVGLALLFFFDDFLLVLLVEELELFRLNGIYYHVAEGLLFLASIGLALAAYRALTNKPATGREGLIGQSGIVSAISNAGVSVRIRGELWQAECQQNVKVGDIVRVVTIDGLTLFVEKVGETDA